MEVPEHGQVLVLRAPSAGVGQDLGEYPAGGQRTAIEKAHLRLFDCVGYSPNRFYILLYYFYQGNRSPSQKIHFYSVQEAK